MEVAVRGVARVTRLRRPHPVADLQVAAEGDHLGIRHGAAECGVTPQRGTVDHEVGDPGGGVIPFQARRIRAFGCPDTARYVSEALPRVGQALAQREFPQSRVQQWLKGMRQRSTQEFDRVGVDQLAKQGAAAMAPQRGEFLEGLAGLAMFANPELAQRLRGSVTGAGGAAPDSRLLATQLPVGQPVLHAGQRVGIVELGGDHGRHAEGQ